MGDSLTLVRRDDAHPQITGMELHMIAHLFCMHDVAVRAWVAEQARAGTVLVADPDWVNPGDGTESLTFPLRGGARGNWLPWRATTRAGGRDSAWPDSKHPGQARAPGGGPP